VQLAAGRVPVGVGQRPGLAQAGRLGGRLGPRVPVRPGRGHRALGTASGRPRRPAVATDGRGRDRKRRDPRRHQERPRVSAVLQESGQVVRGPDGRDRRRAQRQTEGPVPGRDQYVVAAQLIRLRSEIVRFYPFRKRRDKQRRKTDGQVVRRRISESRVRYKDIPAIRVCTFVVPSPP